MAITEWADRWRALASHDLMTGSDGEERMVERWRGLAARLDREQGMRPDPLFDFVTEKLTPEMTVIDVGAGVGRWTIPLAERVRAVTAVEPVPGMRAVLQERLDRRGVSNVGLVEEGWMEADVPVHDVAVAVASMYTSADIVGFARKLEGCSSRWAMMVMRIAAFDGAIGELSLAIHGEWHDSPNFVVGYNALMEAGITPNVFIEDKPISYWADPTLEEAVARAKRHLRLTNGDFDPLIRETLGRRLTRTETGYQWPDGMRSAVVWWAGRG